MRSAARRSVMSSWVPTEYLLPGIARLTIDMARPFGVSATMLSALPAAMASDDISAITRRVGRSEPVSAR